MRLPYLDGGLIDRPELFGAHYRLVLILIGIFVCLVFVAVLFVKGTRAPQAEMFAPVRVEPALDD